MAADAGMVVTAMRSFDEWDRHPQGQAIAAQPLLTIERIGEADPRPLPKYGHDPRPLQDIRVLDLTRIIAGPVCGRALAAYGADVMLVNSPHLPNIANLIDTSRGKLSVHADLDTADGAAIVDAILALSKTLKLRSIAEGIEEADQLRYLVNLRCDLLQGYYFARPLYPEDVPDILRQNFAAKIREVMRD